MSAARGDFSSLPKISEHFPKIFENSLKTVRSSYELFWSFLENFRRLSKVTEFFQALRSYRNKLNFVQQLKGANLVAHMTSLTWLDMFGPRTFEVWQLVTQIFSTAIVNQIRFRSAIRFYNSFILFECENILLAKDMGCFAAFIQTGRQLTSSVKVHLTACQTSNVWWRNRQRLIAN